jgi:nitrous oxidase accessory protein NosD
MRIVLVHARRVAAAAVLAACALSIAAGAAAAGGAAGTLYVSPHGSGTAAGKNCGTAAFATIADAVAAAPAGGTVVVCPGTYAEHVLIDKSLTLTGQNATIDATHLSNGIQVVASNVTVSGFTVENAQGEGVLVGIDVPDDFGLLPAASPVLSGVTIDHVTAMNDDRGFNGTEQSDCQYAGDCGGGIHLNVVANSTVSNSHVVGNADGILLTDDYGPNHDNLVAGNYVADNKTECGIVLPSHNPFAVNFAVNGNGSMTVTGRNPTLGGVYDNVVRDNVTIDNGTATAPPQFGGVGGSGGGVGIFGSFPGAGSYDNLVEGNMIEGNGLAGVTIHAHHPGGSDVNGNQIVDNTFGTNNVMGDAFDGGISNFQTTAIAVYSVPLANMTISGNLIHSDSVGIWLTSTVTAVGLDANTFANVGTPVVVEPPN